MAINVYWGSLTEQWMRQSEPTPLYNDLLKHEIFSNDSITLNKCPAVVNYFKNMFKFKGIYDYNLFFDGPNVHSTYHDQEFFNKNILMRSYDPYFFSFANAVIFFTDEDSLLMSAEHPLFESSDSAKKGIVIPGIYDIGKWYRALDLPILMRPEHKSIEFKANECTLYLKFHTNEKINFIEYQMSEKLRYYAHVMMQVRLFKASKTLSYYYELFKQKRMKSKILKEIKQNIM